MSKRIKGVGGSRPLPQEPKGPKGPQSKMGHRVVTRQTPTKKDISLATKVEGLAGWLREAARESSEPPSKRRKITKGPIK